MSNRIVLNVWTRVIHASSVGRAHQGCSLEDKATDTITTIVLLEPAPDSGAAIPG